jgi:hypothetical protein
MRLVIGNGSYEHLVSESMDILASAGRIAITILRTPERPLPATSSLIHPHASKQVIPIGDRHPFSIP